MPRQVSGIGLAISIAALGYAVQRNNGSYETAAAGALLLALAAAAIAVIGLPGRLRFAREESAVAAIGGCALLYFTYVLLAGPDWSWAEHHRVVGFNIGVACAAALAVTALLERPPLGRAHVPLLLALHAVLGAWVVASRTAPGIDVWYFHQEGLNALLHGHSPYAVTIPNIYRDRAAVFYGPGLVAGDRVLVGYPYPPLSLLLALPGHLLGDYRYALVAATTAAAGLIAYLHPGRGARLAASLLLFSPRVFFVYEQGWTEPFFVLSAAAVAFCAVRAPRLLPVALAAGLLSKQYAVLALPLLFVMFARPADWKALRSAVVIACGLAAAVVLPFLVGDARGFIDSVVLFQLRQPFRADSLSVLAWVAGALRVAPTSAVTLAVVTIALGGCLWRAPRSAAGFVASLALTLLAFFAFGKQAFCNYYFAVASVLACAVAAATAESPDRAAQGGSAIT